MTIWLKFIDVIQSSIRVDSSHMLYQYLCQDKTKNRLIILRFSEFWLFSVHHHVIAVCWTLFWRGHLQSWGAKEACGHLVKTSVDLQSTVVWWEYCWAKWCVRWTMVLAESCLLFIWLKSSEDQYSHKILCLTACENASWGMRRLK